MSKIKSILVIIFIGLQLTIISEKTVASDTLIAFGSVWKYLDNGSNQDTAWIIPSFNDSAWQSGFGEFGYGDGDETTVISYGADANNKYITTYFRKTFNIPDASIYKAIRINLKRDDGAVIYINGTEVYRSNLDTGIVSYTTLTPVAIGGGAEDISVPISLSSSFLINANNVIAVEMHQNEVTSADLSFDMNLIADTTTELIRGPYLQIATPNSMKISWRTTIPEVSKVLFGTSLTYSDTLIDTNKVVNHTVEITGLLPNTQYYYAVASVQKMLAGGAEIYFYTAPVTGSTQSIRIWTMGDIGTGNIQQRLVRDAYYNYTGNTYTNLILFLGDNAYPHASDENYSTNVFKCYDSIFPKSVLYSTCGNHELYHTNALNQTGVYYDIFTLPTNGEAGGVPSGSEAYYSFDYGNIHFVCLESNIDSFGTLNYDSMMTWLNADLTANTQQWTIVYFHHAPYSRGYHNSDVIAPLKFMRENINPVLESFKVDLVLACHSHIYERSHLLYGHYGLSSTFNDSMMVDSTGGMAPSFYSKIAPDYKGTVYIVNGSCGGDITPVQPDWPHPANYAGYDNLPGSVVIDVNADTLAVKFISQTDSIADNFSIVKQINTEVKNNVIEESNILTVFPDPVTNELQIRCQLKFDKEISLSIINSMGQIIKTWKEKPAASLNTKVNVSDLKKGSYFLQVSSGKQNLSKAFIKE
jgi:hypothetical protein